jgi:putative Holliday junction resolvase
VAEPLGRVLALDLGEARIGVAVSDPDRTVALPAGTVGHPLALSGEAGAAATRAEEFAAGLRLLLKVPVHLHDERLTTVEAERRLRAAGSDARARRRAVDATAAGIILESFLAAGGAP